MALVDEESIKVGDFLVENGIITADQLNESLIMQKDNPDRLLGQVIVSIGFLTKEEMIMAIEMYLMMTDGEVQHVDEWLDQDEIDMLQSKLK